MFVICCMSNTRAEVAQGVGAFLRRVRESTRQTQAQVGRKMGLKPQWAQSYVSRLEAGACGVPSLKTVYRYALACGMTLQRLTGLLEAEERLTALLAAPAVAEPGEGQPSALEDLSPREIRRIRQQTERHIVSLLKLELTPVAEKWKGPEHGTVGHYTLVTAGIQFYKAWRRLRRRLGTEQGQAELGREFDRIIAIGLELHFPREALEEVQEAVKKKVVELSSQ